MNSTQAIWEKSVTFRSHLSVTGNIAIWYGGPLAVSALGVFSGAKVRLEINTRCPFADDLLSYDNKTIHPDEEWIVMHEFSDSEVINLPHLNPCALRVVCDEGRSPRHSIEVSLKRAIM